MSKVLIHESGRKTIIAGDGNVKIEVADSNGQVDKVQKVVEIVDLPRQDLLDHMKNPQDFNVKRYGGRELKDHEYRE